MEKVNIKNTDLYVPRICVGGCPFGGYGWGIVNYDDVIETIYSAMDLGANFFDTADVYGLGESERIIGDCLKGRRDKAVIATKFGVVFDYQTKRRYNNSEIYIRRAIEGSLRRLQTDYIDLYQVHYRDGETPLDEVVNTLKALQQEGKIRYFGMSNIHQEQALELKPFKDVFVSFQNEFSLACRKNEEDMHVFSSEYNMTPLTWGSLGQGILTGKYDKNVKFTKDDRRSRKEYVNFHGRKLSKNLKIVDELKKISDEINKPISAIAIRFILDYLKDSIVLVGVKNKKQLEDNVKALDWNLTQEQLDLLNKKSI
ncbi:MAG: aldo/keto reductase [Abditibacteriota bacterium]|nr:aldo/keto reductase [Abditibacteriota bacterium]